MSHARSSPIRDLPGYVEFLRKVLGNGIYLVFLLSMFAALSESFGIVMLLPLLDSLGGGEAGAEPQGTVALFIESVLGYLNVGTSTVATLGIIAFAFMVKGVLTFAAYGLAALYRARLLKVLKSDLFAAYCVMDRQYFDSKDTGHFTNVINEQASRSLLAFQALTQFGSQVVNFLVYIAIAFLVAWKFGVMAVIVGVCLLALFRRINIYVRTLSRKSAAESSRLAKRVIQVLHAFRYLTATGQLQPVRHAVEASIDDLAGYEKRRGMASSFTQTVREPLTVAVVMAVVAVQILYLGEPLEPILVSLALLYRALTAALVLQAKLQGTLDYAGSLEMVRDAFKEQDLHRERGGNTPVARLSEGITLENVTFRYSGADRDAVHDVSLHIPANSSVAFVGESGAGKSSLIDLITLSLRPSAGRVLIDGRDAAEADLGSWRRQIGYVVQDTQLFDDTIANNICMWSGDPARDPDLLARIRTAAAHADIAAHIESLPEQYDTIVGERGARLSGGQRQRLFIARELFRNPNLLILDEATSALDSESERNIQRSIEALMGKTTLIVISHRLSTIRGVDRIYVLEKGRIVDEGSYAELLQRSNSKFGRFAVLQGAVAP